MKSAMITKIILRSRLQSRTRKGRRGVMWMNKTHMICVVVSNQSRRRHLRWSSNWGREEGGSGGGDNGRDSADGGEEGGSGSCEMEDQVWESKK
jgi:hypothetical protein